MRTTLAVALCLFALAMACSRKPLPRGYREAYEDTLPAYGITETAPRQRDAGTVSHVDADLGDRQ